MRSGKARHSSSASTLDRGDGGEPCAAGVNVKQGLEPRLSNPIDLPAVSERRLNLLPGDPPWPAPARWFLLVEAEHEVRPTLVQRGLEALREESPFTVRENMEEAGVRYYVESLVQLLQPEGIAHHKGHS